MARTADIRLFMVSQFPYATFSQHLKVAEKIYDGINKVIATVESKDGDYSKADLVVIDNISLVFRVKSAVKFCCVRNEGMYVLNNLEGFIAELKVLVAMGGTNKYFYDMILPRDADVMYAFNNNSEHLAVLNAHVYSNLTRRHQNRARAGSQNDIDFKLDMGKGEKPLAFSIKNIEFTEKSVSFRLWCECEIPRNAFSSMYDFVIITPELAKAFARVEEIKKEDKQLTPFEQLAKEINQAMFDDLIQDNLIKVALAKGLARSKTPLVTKHTTIELGVYDFEFYTDKSETFNGTVQIVVSLDDTAIYSKVLKLAPLISDQSHMNIFYSTGEQRKDINKFLEENLEPDSVDNIARWIKDSLLHDQENNPRLTPLYCTTNGNRTIVIKPVAINGKEGDHVEIIFESGYVSSVIPFDLNYIEVEELPPAVAVKPTKPRGLLTRLLSVFSW